MTRRTMVYSGGWLLIVLLMVVNQWHRGPAGAPHLHTQLVSVGTFALLVVFSVWGGLMLHRHFDGRTNRLGDPI